jgi:CBS-domain-containing membrane protein
MTREIVACSRSDDVRQARELMEQHRVSRIICTDEDRRIAGIISLSDIVDQDSQGGAHTLHQVSQREVRGDSASRSQSRSRGQAGA